MANEKDYVVYLKDGSKLTLKDISYVSQGGITLEFTRETDNTSVMINPSSIRYFRVDNYNRVPSMNPERYYDYTVHFTDNDVMKTHKLDYGDRVTQSNGCVFFANFTGEIMFGVNSDVYYYSDKVKSGSIVNPVSATLRTVE